MKRAWAVLFVLSLAWIAALLHRGQPLGWDEVEFFRATKWIGEGRVPFRDFWEHHTPLQWIVFAPIARLFGSGAGAGAVVTMRWAQAAVWVAILFLTWRLVRERGRNWSLLFLLTALLFVRPAIEYRVDVLGNLAFMAALVVATRGRWIAFGALMSAAVLSNMRLAPLVVITSLIMLFWRDERWCWNPRALRMTLGVAAVAVPFLAWLQWTGTWKAFVDGVVTYNVASSNLLEVDTLAAQLFAPFLLPDPGAIVLWLAAIAGCAIALREIRTPRVPQIVAIVFLASVVTVAAMEVQYEYHFQGTYLLMVPVAALAFARLERWRWVLFSVAAVAVALNLLSLASPSFGEEMRYQDFVMREVDRRTGPDDRVFDGTGYALRREPAYRYWFLATGVRLLAAEGKLPAYDIATNPPAAVIYNLRMQRWFEIFPKTAAYAVRHYVPLTRDLWVPGMTAILGPGRPVTWVAPAAGRYTLHASEPLLRHPWLTNPLQYAAIQGPKATRYAIPLAQLPPARVQWTVNGSAVAGNSVQLTRGARVTVIPGEQRPVGVLLVPSDVRTLCIAPGEEFQF
jgi:hypothetical protein